MRFDKHHQENRLMNGLRPVLANSWFLNNIKYAQDWTNRAAKQVNNKSYSSSRDSWRHGGVNHWRKIEELPIWHIHSTKSPSFRSTDLSRNSALRLQFPVPQHQMLLISFLFRVRTICNIPISFLALSECVFSILITYFILLSP